MAKKILKATIVMGTRPEVIKLAPVVLEGRRRGHQIRVVLTGQHRELAKPLLKFFGVRPDLSLDVMRPGQTLTGLSARLLEQMDARLGGPQSTDVMLVQGDTTSAFIAAYWAFCHRIPVAHVEAGLRTYDLTAPFPEEANRQLVSRIAHWHFAPTVAAARALRAEGVEAKLIFEVGNSGIDALKLTLKRIAQKNSMIPSAERLPRLVRQFAEPGEGQLVLVTAHRRESFGPAFESMCRGILSLAEYARVVYPVHPNPRVRAPVEAILRGHPNILLCDPLPYVAFVEMMKCADLLLTDSGGVQEEAPTLRKPILVMREKTERPEGVRAGFALLVGTDERRIKAEGLRALGLRGKPWRIPTGSNPYGDGQTAKRIWRELER